MPGTYDAAMTIGDHVPSSSPLPLPAGLVLMPFRAVRYAADADRLARVLCPPYDVIDDETRTALEQTDPHNAVRLILPRDDETGPGSRYRRAAATFADWRAADVLVHDPEPALYVYEMSEPGTVTRGLLGALALSPPKAGIVLPHENTMAGPVADRLALTEATQANLEPIFCVYDGSSSAADIVGGIDAAPPLADTATADGMRHRLWAVTERSALEALAAELLPLHALIADGHHRYATYLQHQADRHRAGHGPGPWDFGLTYLVDARRFGPRVEPIHRVVDGLALGEAVAHASRGFTTTELTGPAEATIAALAHAGADGPAFVLSDGEHSHLLTAPDPGQLAAALPAERSAAWRELDVTVAHQLLIDRLWALRDHEDVVGFEHDAPAALARVRARGGTALLLNPTPIDGVAAVAAAGERMPRKSTLFVPKPRTGMIFRPFV